MPDSRDVRSGKDLKLNAVFVPQDARGLASTHNITVSRGPNTLRLPAVFVAQGRSPPGYPYIHIGKMTFNQDADNRAGQATLPGPKATRPTGAARQGMPPSPHAMTDGPEGPPVAASIGDPGSRSAGNRGRQSSMPRGPAFDDRHSYPDDVVGRAAGLASGYVDIANGTSASQFGIAGSTSLSAMGGDDQALRSLNPSGDAIEAALRALAVPPSSGELPQGADRETMADQPPE